MPVPRVVELVARIRKRKPVATFEIIADAIYALDYALSAQLSALSRTVDLLDKRLGRQVVALRDVEDSLSKEMPTASPDGKAIPLRLLCPQCFTWHIDEGEWKTKLHHTHACQECGNVWRPAVVATVGVKFLPGFLNGELVTEDDAPQPITFTVNGKSEATKEQNLTYEHLCDLSGLAEPGLVAVHHGHYMRMLHKGESTPALEGLRVVVTEREGRP